MDWSLVTSRVAVPRASGRSCTPSKGRCPPHTHTPGRTTATPPGGESSVARQGPLFPRTSALQRLRPAVSPRPPARGRCSREIPCRGHAPTTGCLPPPGREPAPHCGTAGPGRVSSLTDATCIPAAAARRRARPGGRALSRRARHTLRLPPPPETTAARGWRRLPPPPTSAPPSPGAPAPPSPRRPPPPR